MSPNPSLLPAANGEYNLGYAGIHTLTCTNTNVLYLNLYYIDSSSNTYTTTGSGAELTVFDPSNNKLFDYNNNDYMLIERETAGFPTNYVIVGPIDWIQVITDCIQIGANTPGPILARR